MIKIKVICLLLTNAIFASFLAGEIKTPAIIGNNMVLQQNHKNPIWGWDTAGQSVEVIIAGQSHRVKTDKDGYWKITLNPMKASFTPLSMTIKGSSTIEYTNILVGEVWVCSGQSNMGWSVGKSDDQDLESMSANHPYLRLISVPNVGTQEPQDDFDGKWEEATPETAINFSAVGYFFGRRLHQILDVPVGLIDNAWGGSSCEAWIPRDRLHKLAVAKPYMDQWKTTEETFDFPKLQKGNSPIGPKLREIAAKTVGFCKTRKRAIQNICIQFKLS